MTKLTIHIVYMCVCGVVCVNMCLCGTRVGMGIVVFGYLCSTLVLRTIACSLKHSSQILQKSVTNIS